MTNSKFRVGDFYFKALEEPTRVDVKTSKKSKDFGYFMSPYNLLQDQGHQPTSIVMQGYLIDFLVGSTGDWGFEKLKGEISETGEQIIEIPNLDDTNNVRRYYGLPSDIKYTMSNTRPAIFDYMFSFICPNPYAYAAESGGLQSVVKTNAVGVGDSSITLTGLTAGPYPTHPVFSYTNDTGSTITKLEISDGSSISAGNVITVSGSLLNNDSWIIFPIKYLNTSRCYSINCVFQYDGTMTPGIDLYTTLNQDAGAAILKVFTCGGKYPQVTSDAQVIHARATGAADGNLEIQYRKCYG